MLIATWIITCVAIVGAGVLVGRNIQKSNQWTGSDQTLSATGLAAVYAGFQIGGMAIVGAAQGGYTGGMTGIWFSVAGACYFFTVALTAKIMRRIPDASLAVYLENRFGKAPSRFYSYTWVLYTFFYIPFQLLTVSSVIKIAIPNMNTNLAMIVGVSLAVLYTGFSGIKGTAVVGRIVAYGVYILLIGFLFITVNKHFDGFGGLFASVPAEYANPFNMPIQRIVAYVVGGCLGTGIMQTILQPMLATKDVKSVYKGCLMAYLFAGPICLITATIGIIAKASGAELGDGATAFAWTIQQYTSPWLAGVIFAVVTIIISATMAAMMLGAGTIMANIYKADFNPKADDKKVLKFAKYSTFAFAYLSVLPAIALKLDNLVSPFLTLQHVVAGPMFFSLFFGLLWKGATKQGSFWSLVSGMGIGVIWMLLDLTAKVEAIYPVIIVSCVVGYTVSKLTANKDTALQAEK